VPASRFTYVYISKRLEYQGQFFLNHFPFSVLNRAGHFRCSQPRQCNRFCDLPSFVLADFLWDAIFPFCHRAKRTFPPRAFCKHPGQANARASEDLLAPNVRRRGTVSKPIEPPFSPTGKPTCCVGYSTLAACSPLVPSCSS